MKSTHRNSQVRILFLMMVLVSVTFAIPSASSQDWPQWGRNPQHSGAVNVAGQSPNTILANLIYDPCVDQEKSGGGSLPVHYQAALVDGNDVYMTAKTGQYTGRTTWETQIWNER